MITASMPLLVKKNIPACVTSYPYNQGRDKAGDSADSAEGCLVCDAYAQQQKIPNTKQMREDTSLATSHSVIVHHRVWHALDHVPTMHAIKQQRRKLTYTLGERVLTSCVVIAQAVIDTAKQ